MNETTAIEPIAPIAPQNGKRRRVMIIILTVFILLGFLYFLYWFFILSIREQTDDAYVNGNKVVISSQVSGTVVAVFADDTQAVRAGQILVKLDPIDAETALSRSASLLAQAVRQVRQQTLSADQYDSVIVTRRLELARANTDLGKREPLLAEHAIAPEEVRHAREAVELARAALVQAQRQSTASHALVDGLLIEDNPTVQQAKTAYRDAWISSERNAVIAPVAGYVAERSVQLGQHIQAGQALMTVIPLNALWVDANFKEVQLRHLRIGQPAQVHSDLYGSSLVFHGHVKGMSAGTGSAFSLLPAQNASGNWIKVVQRVPVRIQIDADDLVKNPLRIGLSTNVIVDTKDQSGSVLAAQSSDSATSNTSVYTQDLGQANAAANAVVRENLGTGR